MTNPAVLPDKIPALKALIEAQRVEIANLKLLVAKLRRQPFGRRSEKAAELLDQLELQLEELETGDAELASAVAPRPVPNRPKMPRALADHLPRETQVHAPDLAECPDCGGPLQSLGEDVSEILEYVPPASGSSVTCGPSVPVPAATASSRRPPQAGPLPKAWRDRDSWPMCSFRNTPIICRCTASRTSMPAKAWTCRAPP